MRTVSRSFFIFLLSVGLSGCADRQLLGDSEAKSVLCLPSGERWVPVDVELAATPTERRRGLSGRSKLAARQGMLFLYPETQPPENSFWMFETLIPLEVAFLDREGRVVSMRSMRPCIETDSELCPEYPAGQPHHAALEVNDGLFEQLGIAEGDRFKISVGGKERPCEEKAPFRSSLYEHAR